MFRCSSRLLLTFVHRSSETIISIHGAPKVIISDNGPSFSEEVKAFTSSKGIIWKNNIQKAPWMGGIFERAIRYMK